MGRQVLIASGGITTEQNGQFFFLFAIRLGERARFKSLNENQ